MDECERLVEAYIDNELQEADRHTLCAWLQEDRAHVNRFSRACFVHWQLFAIGQRRSLQSGVAEAPRAGIVELRSALVGNHVRKAPPTNRGVGRLGSRAMVAIAASLLMACGVIAWLVSGAGRADMIAQVTRVTADAAWDNSPTAPVAGTFLREGQLLMLKSGRLMATISSGVQVVIQGPATLRIDAGDTMFLQSGRVTISVPRQASGFIVESPLGRFVDLGTDFTLVMQPDSGCELHVFSGLVEMQPNDARRADQLRVPEGRAIEYHAATGTVDTLPYDLDDRMKL